VGSNVGDFAPGDLVSGEGHVICGRCRHCLAGRRHLCARSIGLGVGRDGAFAEYVALPMSNVWHHWPGIDEEVAAIFDPFGNAVHTALAFPVLGEDVLVSGEGHVVCGRCRHCLAGRRHLCARSIGLGVGRDGAFAEYVTLPMTNIWHHWAGIDEEVAAIFDPFGNAVHTALAFPVLGEDVLVSGAGPIGLMATSVARHAGARFIVVSEPNPVRRAIAERMGATLAIDPRERDLREVGRELGMVEGFDVALEMSGNATALRAAIGAMAHGGGIAILGIPTQEISLDVNEIVFKMLTLRGIYGREMYETWYKMTVMLQSGLDIKPAITHRFAFTEHEAAFAAARSGDSGKVIMDWTT
jgi:threonine 3-dehydrogenase